MQSRPRLPALEACSREMFGDLVLTTQTSGTAKNTVRSVPVSFKLRKPHQCSELEKRRASSLVEELLEDIYGTLQLADSSSRSRSSVVEINHLEEKAVPELSDLAARLEYHVERVGIVLVGHLKRRDALRRQQDAHCDVISGQLLKRSASSESDLRFSLQPGPGESGFAQWAAAMKMVAQLPGGIPPDFRRRLWLTLAERHLAARSVDWAAAERDCFSEWSQPADAELGVQIVKDLHRTGCSLFCGEGGAENQALLKRVLLAYARWNKAVGYCQGFNMLAALILQVTDRCEADALKLMIYLIEGVLPDSYFADSLRGLSVDMAVFRELLRARLPRLSKHLDALQDAAKDGTTSYEPPLTNVFTMQWFLTLFCNCLPQPTVLRVWDLILLEGNEILLRTALAIWQTLADRIMGVRSADEFYCIMGVLTRELLEFELIDGNALVKAVVAIGPLTELRSLREHYMYNINPWGASVPTLFPDLDKQVKLYAKDRLVLDISALKKQYAKLKQRQRQAHIIFSAAISRQPPPSAPVAMNHLLLGKSALVPAKRLGPPKGSIPPARVPPSTLLWKDAPKTSDSSSSSDTELCDEASESLDEEEQALEIKSQFVDDNLMNKDNKGEDDSSRNGGDIFDSAASASVKDIFDSVVESDEDSVDFEKFLQDRVRCLKEIKSPSDEEEEGAKAKYGRRNSERALQIIQENSLILHRIMQCQSRLSPTCIDEDLTMAKEGVNVEPEVQNSGTTDDGRKSPEYGSRYSSILEKSRNLDEKYNSLILNASVNLRPVMTVDSEPKSDLISELRLKYDSIDLGDSNFKFNSGDSFRISNLHGYENVEEEIKEKEKESGIEEAASFIDSPIKSRLKSPGLDFSDKSSGSKSPNKVFNPFPISLNTRQNKEVPLKLGLYKK